MYTDVCMPILAIILMAEYSSRTYADASFTGSTDCTWHCMIFKMYCIVYANDVYLYTAVANTQQKNLQRLTWTQLM